MKKIATFIIPLLSFVVFSQHKISFDRLKVIANNGIYFYSIDGYHITSETLKYNFDKKLKKAYKKYNINRKSIKTPDDSLAYKNYYTYEDIRVTDSITQKYSHYFIKNKEKKTTVITFSFFNKRDRKFERAFINTVFEKKIPRKCFSSIEFNMTDFAGRFIKLDSKCVWRNVNNIQCPYYGQMNWSIHKNLKSAENYIRSQFEITKLKKGNKIISEELVTIEFEGTKTKAKKVILDIKGINSLLIGLSGGKTLTIYYVSCKVRSNYIACVLSFWNNDVITQNGISPLLEQVMKI